MNQIGKVYIVPITKTMKPSCCICDSKYISNELEELIMSFAEDIDDIQDDADDAFFGYQAIDAKSNNILGVIVAQKLKEEVVYKMIIELLNLGSRNIPSEFKRILLNEENYNFLNEWIEIQLLCVIPSAIGHGIANLLYETLITKARKDGFKYATLRVAHEEDNPRAVAFYKKKGFKLIPLAKSTGMINTL